MSCFFFHPHGPYTHINMIKDFSIAHVWYVALCVGDISHGSTSSIRDFGVRVVIFYSLEAMSTRH